jgi:hypothetical protein
LRLGLFASGLDETAYDILSGVLRSRDRGELDVSFTFAFCAWEEGEAGAPAIMAQRRKFMERARSQEIPLVMLSAQRVRDQYAGDPTKDWKVCFGRQLRKLLYERAFELGVMDGRMVVDEDTCVRFDLLGLCHSLPEGPRGESMDILRQVLTARPKAHGLTTRVCTGRRETALPMTYCSYSLGGGEVAQMWRELEACAHGRPLDQLPQPEIESTRIFQHLLREGRARAPPLVTYTIKLFADGDLDIVNGKPVADGMNLTSPIDLSQAVDRALAQGQF